MSAQVTAEQIAQAIGVTRSAVQKRAERECWMHVESAVRGGRRHLYTVGTLPDDVRENMLAHLAKQEATAAAARSAGRAEGARLRLVEAIDDRAVAAAREHGLANFLQLPEPRQRKADARAAMVDLANRYRRVSGLPKKRAVELFCHQYSTGRIEVPEWLRETIRSVSANSIANWQQQLEREGLSRLAGKQGEHRRGQGIIDTTPQLRELILGMISDHPDVSAKLVIRAIRARIADVETHPSFRTLQRWMADWRETNKQLATAIANPDAWRSRYQAAGGNASAHIVRLNQRWEADSTKADLMLSDGTRHVIVGIIDVYSRRLKLHVSRSSSSAAVAATLRRSLIDWGVPEQLGTDNGSDYVSDHVTRVVRGLGIEQHIAPPFTPEAKPHIERAFGTFCRDLLELLDGYIGHSVAERKAIEAKRSFAQRLMKQGEKVELRKSAEELQGFCDRWTDQVYAIDPHSGLNGKSPAEVAAAWPHGVRRIEDERALDVLLSAAPGDGVRTITKKGIRLDNALFEAPELGGLEGQDVRVLLDEADIGEIYVFDLDGKFLVKAICPERKGISRQELSAKRKAVQKRVIGEKKAEMKANSKNVRTEHLVEDILRDSAAKAAQSPKVVALRVRDETHSTPDLAAAAIAARADRREEPAVPVEVAARRASQQQAIEAELVAPAQVIQIPPPEGRFQRARDLERRIAAGELVSDEDRAWLQRYQQTPHYRTSKAMADDFGAETLTA
jgi:transposase InsO family protein